MAKGIFLILSVLLFSPGPFGPAAWGASGQATPCHFSGLAETWARLFWPLALLGGGLALMFAATRRPKKKSPDRPQGFADAAEALGECFWELDEEGRFTYLNSAIKNILGYEPQELIGKSLYDLCHPYERQAIQQVFLEDLREKRAVKDALHRLAHKEGRFVTVQASAMPVLGPDGEAKGLRGIVRDVTQQKQAEESVRMLAQFPAENPDPVMRVDIKGSIVYANPASRTLCASLGWEKGESVPAQWRQSILQALSSGRSQEVEVQVKDRVLSLVIAPASAAAAVHIYGRDVTERNHTQQKLAESERRYQDLYDNAPDLYLTLDPGGRIKSVNQYGAEYLGYRREDLLGHSIWEFVHPEDHGQVKAWAAEAISQRRQQSQWEHRVVRRDKSLIWMLQRSRLIFDQKGEMQEWRIISRDITESRRSQEQLQLAAQVIQNSIEGIQVTDAAGIVQMINPAYTFITGFTAEEVVGKEGFISPLDGVEQQVMEQMWQDLKDRGRWSGEIWSRRKDGEAYPKWLNVSVIKDPLGHVVNYICIFRDMTLIKDREEKIKYLASHDPLTGLPNRLLFEDRLKVALARARRHKGFLALLFVDLDDFKQVNDRLGHAMGDLLLQQMAGRMMDCVRAEDTVARFGGDEFLLILQEIKKPTDAEDAAARILKSLVAPFWLKGREVTVSASVGVSLYPEDGRSIDILLKKADLAMYGAKDLGKNKFRRFGADLAGPSSAAEKS